MTLRSRARHWAAGVVVALLVLTVAGRLVRLPYASTVQGLAGATVGEIAGSLEVGQSFESLRPRLRAVAVQFATYGGRENTEEVLFELREGSPTGSVVRTDRVSARDLKDHRMHAFRFASLHDARGKTYYAAVRSPRSRPGNAVTVDISNRNPYAKVGPSSLALFRTNRRDEETVAQSVKPHADLTFSVTHEIPAAEYVRLRVLALAEEVQSDPRRFTLLALFASVGLLFGLGSLVPALPRPFTDPAKLPFVLGAVVLLGLVLRVVFAAHLPATNDEGTALYDAWTVREGRLPGGDGIVKAPVFVGAFAVGLAALGPTLANARLVSVLAGLLTAVSLLVIARATGLRGRWAYAVGALWLLGVTPAIFGAYVHAQPLQTLLVSTGLALLASALRAQARRPLLLAFLAGGMFALGLGVRKTTAALALPSLVLLVASARPWRQRAAAAAAATIGFVAVLGVLVGIEQRLYGFPGVQYFLGVDVAKIDPATTASADERRSAFVKGVLPLFREGLPLLFLALAGLGAAGEEVLRRVRAGPSEPSAARLAWLFPIALAWAGGSFLRANERGEHLAFGVWPYWVVLIGTLIAALLLPRRRASENTTASVRQAVVLLALPLAWIVGTAFIYASWIKFTANYLAEFLPPLTLLAALGARGIGTFFRPQRLVVPLAVLVAAWGSVIAARSGYAFPHTGTFDLSSLHEAAAVLRSTVPREELVLTAAVAIPFLSGHRVPFDVAHPTHYAYGFIEPRVRNVYLAPAEEMVRTALRDVRWVVLERLTDFSYFREYPEIKRHVEENFTDIREIENLSNPITILRRRDAGNAE